MGTDEFQCSSWVAIKGHLEDFAADMVRAFTLIEHSQEHAQQLRVLYVWCHHQTCALYHLQHSTVHLTRMLPYRAAYI